MSALEIEAGGESWVLLPERAVWWPRKRWLLIADTHWGKDETFRAFGVPLPDGLLAEGLTTLTRLAEQWDPEAFWVLGDLIHHRVGLTSDVVDAVAEWRNVMDKPIHLVPGNHDRSIFRWPDEWRLSVESPVVEIDGIGLCHDPADTPDNVRFSWAGHLHPTCQVGGGRQRLRLPCFARRENVGLLPAFNTFTGGPALRDADALYPIADGRVFDLA